MGCARVTGKAGDNGQSTQGLSELRLDLGWGPGQPGFGVAIDWVTSQSCSSATKAGRLDVQSGLRKGLGRVPVRA